MLALPPPPVTLLFFCRCAVASVAASAHALPAVIARHRYQSTSALSSGNAVVDDLIADADAAAATASPAAAAAAGPAAVRTGAASKREFQAETRQLLDIVTNSLYTDREVFVRELVSNASDALEKVRYLERTDVPILEKNKPLEISITVDEAANTLTLQDAGLGMTDAELIENLGTIARSGSKQFLKRIQSDASASGAASGGTDTNIIGKFGVGFYSVFMVCDKVEVWTRSHQADAKAYHWQSDGSGEYEIAEADNVERGTKIVVHLKTNAKEFAIRHNIERIIKKYSNFVGFPIKLNGERVNNIRALWADDKSTVSKQQYEEFYRYVANAFDKPRYTQHFHTDAPLSIHALFFTPEVHTEKAGLGRMEPGVNLYSRKVMIQAKSPVILPDWLRFMRGVVDSEDIPLNISRETMQDSALIKRIRNVLTKKVLSFFEAEGKRDPAAYNKFFEEFGSFLKEGVIADPNYKDAIARLLRFESSRLKTDEVTSLDEYIARMPSEQKNIYFLCMPTRAVAELSPYYEQFKANNTEVLFVYQQLDEISLKSLEEYTRRKIVSIESSDADADLPKRDKAADDAAAADADAAAKSSDAGAAAAKPSKLTSAQTQDLVKWLERTLSARVSSVKVSSRLVSSPAIITDHESASVRRLMTMIGGQGGGADLNALRKQKLEINPSHPLMVRLAFAAKNAPERAAMVAEQMFDNAAIAAGLLDDPRTMLGRLNSILESSLTAPAAAAPATSESPAPTAEASAPKTL